MKLSLKAVNKAREKFVRKFFKKDRAVYIDFVSTSIVCIHDNSRLRVRGDDHCIVVHCKKPLPESLSLPKTFCKIRVFIIVLPEPVVAQRIERR